MSNMEFLRDNLLNTTTQLKVDSNTALTDFLFDRNINLLYETSGYTTNTSTIISIEFDDPTVVSNIVLLNHNFKQFRAFYNSVTANTFSIDINETKNSDSSSYFNFDSLTVNSIQIQIDEATEADVERTIGQLISTEKLLSFENNPEAKKYKPNINITRVKHKMPDGGITMFNIKDKFSSQIGLRLISESERDNLFDIYEAADPLYFLPFPTTSAWDGKAYSVLWTSKFDFRHEANVKASGFTGKIILEERASG